MHDSTPQKGKSIHGIMEKFDEKMYVVGVIEGANKKSEEILDTFDLSWERPFRIGEADFGPKGDQPNPKSHLLSISSVISDMGESRVNRDLVERRMQELKRINPQLSVEDFKDEALIASYYCYQHILAGINVLLNTIVLSVSELNELYVRSCPFNP